MGIFFKVPGQRPAGAGGRGGRGGRAAGRGGRPGRPARKLFFKQSPDSYLLNQLLTILFFLMCRLNNVAPPPPVTPASPFWFPQLPIRYPMAANRDLDSNKDGVIIRWVVLGLKPVQSFGGTYMAQSASDCAGEVGPSGPAKCTVGYGYRSSL